MSTTLDLPPDCMDALSGRMDPELFQALCDPTRVALVAHLAASARPLTVTEASGCCGVHFSGVSRHLAVLRRAGVVRAEKNGREVRYQLEVDRLASTLRGVADALETCWRQGTTAASEGAHERNPA